MSDINDFGRTSFVMHTTGLKERLEKRTMDEQQEKLLAVLDMSKDEQRSWCWFNIESVHDRYYRKQDISLADLAFRLRDEAVEKDWVGWQIGSAHVWGATHKSEYNPGKFGSRAKPIHWIIAALLAKESK